MIIEDTPVVKSLFSELGDGDAFIYAEIFYMKIAKIITSSTYYSAVSLTTGKAVAFPPDLYVEPINGRFFVERN